MKIKLTYKEANLLNAILWELSEESGIVVAENVWRLSNEGADVARSIMDELETANNDLNVAKGKRRDLSGAPKGTTLDAAWKKS